MGGRRTVAIAVLALVSVMLVVWWFVLRPDESSVSIAVSLDRVTLGTEVVVTGSALPASEGQEVTVNAIRADGSSADVPVVLKARTDSTGQYSITWKPASAGDWALRANTVSVDEPVVTGESVGVTVLSPTEILSSLSPNKLELPTGSRLAATGRVAPAGVRDLVLQSSKDLKVWADVAKTSAAVDGTYKITVPTAKPGTFNYRIVALETNAAGQGSSKPMAVIVADYKAAGVAYARCAGPYNEASERWSDLALLLSPARYETEAKRWEAALRTSVACIEKVDWPRAVRPYVAKLQQYDTTEANWSRKISNLSEASNDYYDVLFSEPSRDGYAAAANEIRGTLNLPKRPRGLSFADVVGEDGEIVQNLTK